MNSLFMKFQFHGLRVFYNHLVEEKKTGCMVRTRFCCWYNKTCIYGHSQKTVNWFLRPIIAKCRSKVLQNAPKGAFCNTFYLQYATICHSGLCSVYFEWQFYTGFTVVYYFLLFQLCVPGFVFVPGF